MYKYKQDLALNNLQWLVCHNPLQKMIQISIYLSIYQHEVFSKSIETKTVFYYWTCLKKNIVFSKLQNTESLSVYSVMKKCDSKKKKTTKVCAQLNK